MPKVRKAFKSVLDFPLKLKHGFNVCYLLPGESAKGCCLLRMDTLIDECVHTHSTSIRLYEGSALHILLYVCILHHSPRKMLRVADTGDLVPELGSSGSISNYCSLCSFYKCVDPPDAHAFRQNDEGVYL